MFNPLLNKEISPTACSAQQVLCKQKLSETRDSTQPQALRSQGMLASLLLPTCHGLKAYPPTSGAPGGAWLNPLMSSGLTDNDAEVSQTMCSSPCLGGVVTQSAEGQTAPQMQLCPLTAEKPKGSHLILGRWVWPWRPH